MYVKPDTAGYVTMRLVPEIVIHTCVGGVVATWLIRKGAQVCPPNASGVVVQQVDRRPRAPNRAGGGRAVTTEMTERIAVAARSARRKNEGPIRPDGY